MQTSTSDEIRAAVRQAYGAVATRKQSGCCGGTSCCGPGESASRQLGYSDEDLAAVPDGADLGLGCGNPQAIAGLKPGERVLDLGSGAGFDAFLAARQVGPGGFVTGVDMTPEMVDRARANAGKTRLAHVDFRLGDIEQLPVEDASVDVIMSNCVINLAPDKAAVFREAFRVLAPGGRLAISDVVAIGDVPAAVAADPAAYTGCIAGAAPVGQLERMIADAGFTDVRIVVPAENRSLIEDWSPGTGAAHFVASALIEAVKPAWARHTHANEVEITEDIMNASDTTPATSNADARPPVCCDSVRLDTCCAPQAKPACCGPSAPASSCGCQPGPTKR